MKITKEVLEKARKSTSIEIPPEIWEEAIDFVRRQKRDPDVLRTISTLMDPCKEDNKLIIAILIILHKIWSEKCRGCEKRFL